MAKSIATSNSILKLIFNATAWANMADNAATSPYTNLYLSLHTADPGTGNNQTTNETSYTNYVRIALARTSGGWTVSTNTATNAALAQFAAESCQERTAVVPVFTVQRACVLCGRHHLSSMWA